MSMATRLRLPVALAAIASCAIAALVAGRGTEGFSHLQHPLALLGARQMEAGTLFGLFAFVLPGLAVAWIALELRARLPAGSGWPQRIGAQLALLAALAFAAQGVLPLDLDAMDTGASRLHAAAWLLWALAFPLGALALAAGLWRAHGWRRFALLTALAGVLVVACGFLGSGWVGAALAQRLAFAAWLGWGVLAALAPAPR